MSPVRITAQPPVVRGEGWLVVAEVGDRVSAVATFVLMRGLGQQKAHDVAYYLREVPAEAEKSLAERDRRA